MSLIPGLGRSPGVVNDNLFSFLSCKTLWTEELVDYSPWGLRGLDAPEHTYYHKFVFEICVSVSVL